MPVRKMNMWRAKWGCLVLLSVLGAFGACRSDCARTPDEGREDVSEKPIESTSTTGIVMNEKEAARIMDEFARRTGLTSEKEPTRYLWTDAFAVCNFIGLARQTGDERHLVMAKRLVDQVHQTLGRHRRDDPRTGWLSGLEGEEAKEHPTAGGLRIGKKLSERGREQPMDRRREWDRDGQYFHYLTKWMHALDLMSRATGEPRFNRWARELAETAHDGFVYRPPGEKRPRMYWKMSIDLSRPLVASMGHHDPLDGYVTYRQLMEGRAGSTDLGDEIESFATMMEGRDWSTTDPLGLGGLLMDATRLEQVLAEDAEADRALVGELLRDAEQGVAVYVQSGALDGPARQRLAFRELGLAIGLAAVEMMPRSAGHNVRKKLAARGELRTQIVQFWSRSEHQELSSWTGHLDINQVMLATALAPGGCLRIPTRGPDQ